MGVERRDIDRAHLLEREDGGSDREALGVVGGDLGEHGAEGGGVAEELGGVVARDPDLGLRRTRDARGKRDGRCEKRAQAGAARGRSGAGRGGACLHAFARGGAAASEVTPPRT